MPRIKLYTGNNKDEYTSLTVDNFSDFIAKAKIKLPFTAHKYIAINNDDGAEIDDEDTFEDLLNEYPNLEVAAFKKDEKFIKKGVLKKEAEKNTEAADDTIVFGASILSSMSLTRKPNEAKKATKSMPIYEDDEPSTSPKLADERREIERKLKELEARENEQKKKEQELKEMDRKLREQKVEENKRKLEEREKLKEKERKQKQLELEKEQEKQLRELDKERKKKELEIKEKKRLLEEQQIALKEKERKVEEEFAKKQREIEDQKKRIKEIEKKTKITAVNAEDLELKIAEIKMHKIRISNMFEELKRAENVDLCFLVDCTGSMDRHIKETKDVIHKIVARLKAMFEDLKIRLAFVGYRDHSDRERFAILPFTSEKDQFRSFVQEVKAYGGGDDCEDVFGGLKKASELDWQHMSRIVFHIADAPCHGARYHTEELGDDFPNGHPNDPKIDDLFKTFGVKNINYHFAKINESTDKMLEEFAVVVANNNALPVKVFALGRAEDITGTVMQSIIETVNGTKSRSMNNAHGKNKKALVKGKLSWEASQFTRYSAKLNRPSYKGKIKDLKSETLSWESQDVVVYKAKNPFDAGAMRFAIAAYLDTEPSKKRPIESLPKYVLKTSQLAGIEFNTMKYNREAIECQVLTRFLANEFNKVSPSQKQVKCSEVSIVQLDSDGSIYCIEPFLPGKYIKWTNNAGFINLDDLSETLLTFSHWTFVTTNKYLLVCDLQGVANGNQYILTDPAIASSEDFERFNLTNTGLKGIKVFFKSHHCNHICEKMRLEKQPNQIAKPYVKPSKATELRRDL